MSTPEETLTSLLAGIEEDLATFEASIAEGVADVEGVVKDLDALQPELVILTAEDSGDELAAARSQLAA